MSFGVAVRNAELDLDPSGIFALAEAQVVRETPKSSMFWGKVLSVLSAASCTKLA